MKPVITDNAGNTPVLQAAQPRTMEQVDQALQKLKEAVAAGTLVVTEIPSTVTSIHPYETVGFGSVEYDEVDIDIQTDPDLCFDFITTTRKQFVETISKLPTNEMTLWAENVGPELLEHFQYRTLTCPNHEWSLFIESYVVELELLESTFANIKSQIVEQDVSNYDVSQLISYLKSDYTSQPQLAAELEEVWRSYTEAKKIALESCSTGDALTYYLNQIQTTQISIGHCSLLYFAARLELPLKIWTKQPNNELKILGMQEEGCNEKNTINLSYTNVTTPFKLLMARSIAQKDPYTLKLSKVYEPLKEKNIDGHNLLHRAVRSTAADILVPYLLNDLNFKDPKIINATDRYGKTALHRAIKYFPDFRNRKILADDYHLRALKCFEALLACGASLDIQDNKKQTPLERALVHKQDYAAAHTDKNFNLPVWLIEKSIKPQHAGSVLPSQPYPSNTSRAPSLNNNNNNNNGSQVRTRLQARNAAAVQQPTKKTPFIVSSLAFFGSAPTRSPNNNLLPLTTSAPNNSVQPQAATVTSDNNMDTSDTPTITSNIILHH